MDSLWSQHCLKTSIDIGNKIKFVQNKYSKWILNSKSKPS